MDGFDEGVRSHDRTKTRVFAYVVVGVVLTLFYAGCLWWMMRSTLPVITP